MNEILIDIKNIRAGYNGKVVLHDLSLKIYQQDFLGITGANGCGKTTLVKVILGLIKPLSGEVCYAHKELKKRIGYMPQTNYIDRKFPILVSEVVASGLSSGGKMTPSQKKEKVSGMIREMGLEKISHRPIGELSGGQLQRTLLARAMVNTPELLILDEPNAYVDKSFETHFYELLQEINKKTAIVLISHDLDAVAAMAKHSLSLSVMRCTNPE
ncbi:MAG: ATP-binding cassette domain-containing protein [Dysgonamonadaceae bacterium]|jgi:zinc transport system ATP-binding protein|nr:ATP-binding cassette domain-containing protein [Dysgonamonadaceae bacterium]